MTYIRVILFLIFVSIIAAVIVKYVILAFLKVVFKENKFFNRLINKSNIEKDLPDYNKVGKDETIKK